jgi:hypothetical protein
MSSGVSYRITENRLGDVGTGTTRIQFISRGGSRRVMLRHQVITMIGDSCRARYCDGGAEDRQPRWAESPFDVLALGGRHYLHVQAVPFSTAGSVHALIPVNYLLALRANETFCLGNIEVSVDVNGVETGSSAGKNCR